MFPNKCSFVSEKSPAEDGYTLHIQAPVGLLHLNGGNYQMITPIGYADDVCFCKVMLPGRGGMYEGGLEFSNYAPWVVERSFDMKEIQFWALRKED